MSSSVDNKIVKMQFDNAQFEAGVMKSMNTIDKLNEKLQFKESKKGVSALQVALDGIDFNAMLRGVQNVEHAFTSFTGMIGQKIKTEIVDSLINGAKQIEQATIGQIKSGGWARATNIANAKFTIEGLKYSWDEVRAAADYAVTDTAYGLDAAAKAASQLAASGVDFHKVIGKDGAGNDVTQMHKALRGVSGVAAMTNSDFSEIAHIFTRIAGQGKVMANDLNSIAARGINAAAEMAKQFGITEGELRDLVSKGQISFNDFAMAMDDAFGDHAKEANKTFSGSLSNMKAALSRIGAIFAQPVMDKTNTFFIAVTSRIKEFQKALSNTTGYNLTEKGLKKIRKKAEDTLKSVKGLSEMEYANRLSAEINRLKDLALGDQLKESLKIGDVESYPIMRFAGHFEEAWEAGVNAASKIVENLDLSWFQNIGTFLDNVAIKMKTVFDGIVNYYEGIQTKFDSVRDKMRATIGISLEDWKYINEVAIKGSYGTMQERWDKLDKDIKETLDEEGGGKRIQGYVDQFAAVGYVWEKLGWDYETVKKKQNELNKAFETGVRELSGEELIYASVASAMDTAVTSAGLLKEAFFALFAGAKNIGKAIGQTLVTAFHYFSEGFDTVTISASLKELASAFSYFTEALLPTEGFLSGVGAAAQTAGTFLSGLLTKVIQVATAVVTFAGDLIRGTKTLDDLKSAADASPIEKFAAGIVVAFTNIKTVLSNAFTTIKKILGSIKTAFTKTFKSSGVSEQVGGLTDKLSSLSEKFVLSDDSVEKLTKAFEYVFGIVKKVGTGFKSLLSTVTGLFSKKGLGALGKSTSDAAREIADMADEVVTVSINTEKAEGIFYRLRIILHNIIEAVKEAPGKFKAFIDELKESEAVENLKNSFTRLKDAIRNTMNEVLPPAEKAIGVLSGSGDTVEEETTSMSDRFIFITEKIVEGITWVVDKMVWLVEQIPSWKDSIVGFFDSVQGGAALVFDFVTTKIDEIGKKFGIDKTFENLSKEWKTASEDGTSILSGIKNFGASLFDTLSGTISNIDWGKVGKVSLLGLAAADMFGVFRVLSAGEGLLTSIKTIPDMVGKMFKSLSGMFGGVQESIKKLTNVYIFTALVGAMVALISALMLLKDVKVEELSDAIAVMVILAGIMVAIAFAVSLLNKNTKQVVHHTGDFSNNAQFAVMQITAAIPKIFGVAAVILAIGGAFAMIIKAIGDAAPALDKLSDKTIEGIVDILWGITAGIAIMVGVVGVLIFVLGRISDKTKETKTVGKRTTETITKTTKESTELIKGFIGFAIAIGAIAGAVYLLVEAMAELSTKDISGEAGAIVIGMFAGILILSAILMKSAQNVQAKPLLALVAVLATIFLGMYLIISQIVLLGTVLETAAALGGGEGFMLAMGAIAAIIAIIFLSMGYMLKQMYVVDSKSVKALVPLLWSLIGGIVVVVAAIGILGSIWSGIDPGILTNVQNNIFWSTIAMIVLATALQRLAIELNDKGFTGAELATTMGVLVGAILVVAAATYIMANAFDSEENILYGAAGFLAGFATFALMAVAFKFFLDMYKGIDLDLLKTTFMALAGMMLAMSASVLIIGIAAALMSTATDGAIIGAIVAFVVMIGAMFAVLFALAKMNLYPGELESLALAIFAIGGMMIMIAVAGMVFAKAAQMMSGVSWGDLAKAVVPIIAIMALITVLGVVLAKSGNGGKIVDMIGALAGVFLTLSLSLLLTGVAIGVMGYGLGVFAEGFAKLVPIVQEHWVIALVIVGVLIVLALVLSKVIGIAQPFIAMILGVGSAIINIVNKVINGLSAAFDWIKEHLGIGSGNKKKSLISKLKEWWDKLQPQAKYAIATGVITIIGGLAAAAPEALEKLSDIIFTVMKWLIKLVPKIIDFLVELLITIVNGLADVIRNKGARIAQALFNLLEALGELIIHVAADVILAFFNWIPGVEKAVESLSTIGITAMRKGMKGVNNYTESMEALNGVVDDTEMAMTSLAAASDLSKATDKTGKAIGGLASGFGDALSKVTGGQSGLDFTNVLGGNSLGDTVKNMFGGGGTEDALGFGGGGMSFDVDAMLTPGDIDTSQFGAGMTDALSNFDASQAQSGDMAALVGNLTGGSTDDMYNFGSDYGEAFGEGEATTYTTTVAQEIDSPDNREEIYSATTDVMASETERAMKDAEPHIRESTTTHVTASVTTAITSGFPKIFAAAGQIIPGIVGVLEAGKPMLEVKAAELGDIMDKGFRSKDGIDSHSPSKKFYQAGLFCVLGVRDAIAENTGLASDAMFNLSDQMINSFGDPLDYVSKMASGEIQYDPSIRPILDTSMLGTGANAINSMFTNQNVSLTGMSGQIAYDMSTLNGSNAAVVAEIQALREDMDYMTEQMTNMQIVMDTGALVGATSGAMDKDLGMKRLYSERGDL